MRVFSLRSLIFVALAITASAVLFTAAFVPLAVAPAPVAVALCCAALAYLIVTAPTLRFKRVLRLDDIQKHLRLFRLMWERGTVGDGNGYSAKLAIGLRPRIFEREREYGGGFLMTLLGLRIHYSRSYGGTYA